MTAPKLSPKQWERLWKAIEGRPIRIHRGDTLHLYGLINVLGMRGYRVTDRGREVWSEHVREVESVAVEALRAVGLPAAALDVATNKAAAIDRVRARLIEARSLATDAAKLRAVDRALTALDRLKPPEAVR
jgi:hypothetical protein